MLDPTCAVHLLAALFLLTAPPTDSLPDGARAAFERFRALAGEWEEQSTKGWTGSDSVRVIARGSAVLFTSAISVHPGEDENMATVVHLDRGRLLLTHYCVAGNQPRLAATNIAEDGNLVEFTFVDGTNLVSRDAGHMDHVLFRFADRDHYTSKWTWYENGRERWMEDIAHRRRH